MERKNLKISEKEVQQAVTTFLAFDGWRPIRTELTVQRDRGRVVGERGMPDMLFIRYDPLGLFGEAQVIWIEMKAPGAKKQKHEANQLAWRTLERKRGGYVMVVDDAGAFSDWYKKSSGFNRRWKA